ncbi:MAG: RNA polymerase sigma factor [Actinomycetota bacterium]|nr:RNA polymerase sigma factor [Actinomycetota bacterium]
MLGNVEDAAEAVQQTFLSAYRDLTASSKEIALRAWLFAIARNRCLSMLRVRREHADVEVAEPATEGLAVEVARREDLRELLGDLSRLPEDQRAAIVLAEIGSLGHGEIGDVLGCSREKVKALVFQARSSLAASRQARATSCPEIREQLATLRGGALRRTTLRRHLRECAGCREFNDEVRRQRQAFALILPVAPVAGLKEAVLSGAGVSGGAAAGTAGAGGAAAGLGALGAKSLTAKLLVGAAVIGGGTAGGLLVSGGVGGGDPVANGSAAATASAASARSAWGGAGGIQVSSVASEGVAAARASTRAAAILSRPSGSVRGGTGAGASSGVRGKGKARGLSGTQPGQRGRSSPSRTNQAGGGQNGGATKPGGGQGGKSEKAPAGNVVAPVTAPKPSAAPPQVAPTPSPQPKPAGKGESGNANDDAHSHGHGHGHAGKD